MSLVAQTAASLFDALCPLHLIVDRCDRIMNVGPTLRKLRAAEPFEGRSVFDLLELKRPSAPQVGLKALSGKTLHFKMRGAPHTPLKGVALPLGEQGWMMLNLSFGISILEAVQDYALTSSDFAPTDPTIEMLYLMEAKSAAMEAALTLNERLQGARLAAEEQASTDTLTGLRNRRAMGRVLGEVVANGISFGLMQVDLDYFKTINDTLGHAAGDHVLRHVAQIMVEETRVGDTVARTGGDEFVVIFDGLTDRRMLDRIALRLIKRLQEPISYQGKPCRISCSIGTVISTDYPAPTAAILLRDSDRALYASKHAGRSRHTFFDAGAADLVPESRCAREGDTSLSHLS